MLNHRKLGKWTPPGGKIDAHEIPEEAAIRETKEETGLDVKLIGQEPVMPGLLVQPFALERHWINETLAHIDFIYLAKVIGSETPIWNEKESLGIKWCSLEDLKQLNTFDSCINWTDFFVQKINSTAISL